jgi:hypothetical protein
MKCRRPLVAEILLVVVACGLAVASHAQTITLTPTAITDPS